MFLILKLNQPVLTILNFVKLAIARYLGINFMGEQISDIFNYRKIDEKIATGGQPTVEQIKLIEQAGYQTVINLALATSENALADEAAVVESLGMKYIHIPIEFTQPTIEQFDRFTQAMQDNQQDPVFIHCAANLRVSVFVYLYRIQQQGLSPEQAQVDLYQLWQPNKTWQNLIDRVLSKS